MIRTLSVSALVACFLGNGCAGGDPPDPRDRGPPTGVVAAGDPALLARQLGVSADSLRSAGEERYSRGDFDSARVILEVELARAVSVTDPAAEARARTWLGLVAYRQSNFAVARSQGEAGLAGKRQAGLDAELSQSFNALGLLAWQEGRPREALIRYDSALASASRHNDANGIARAQANRALVQAELGEFEAARAGFLAAIEAGRTLGNARLEANSVTNLANLEIRLGYPDRALTLLVQARARYREIGYPLGEQNALGQMATAWSAQNELQRAIAAADSALAITRAHGLAQEEASTLEVLADLMVQSGDPRRALALLRVADSIDEIAGLVVERGTNRRRESLLIATLEGPTPALPSAREALLIHLAAEARDEAFEDRIGLAELHRMAGSLDSVGGHLDTAQVVARDLGSPRAERGIALARAQLALAERRPRDALAWLKQGGDDWRAWDARASARAGTGDPRGAREAAENAVLRLERERISLGAGTLGSGFLASRTDPIARLIALSLATGDTVAAFTTAARVAGRDLLERQGTAGSQDLASERRLFARVAALERELDSEDTGASAERRDSVARLLASARRDVEDQVARVGTTTRAAILGAAPPDRTVLARSLEPGELLITTFVGPEQTELFALGPVQLRHASAPLGERELGLRVRRMRAMLTARGDPDALGGALEDLYSNLIAALIGSGAQPFRRLLIVPHGVLAALPWSALRNPATGRYLVEDAEIVLLPAAGALPALRSRERASRALEVFVPRERELPGTLREARAIARQIPGTVVLRGQRSNEAAFVRALGTGRNVHLASHGELDPANPLFSRVTLGDGFLELHEVLGLDVTSPLVFLSGCETAATNATASFGPVSPEGSLAQGFLSAGASNVVATLWRVGDEEAAMIAARFYAHLAAKGPAGALAISQRKRIGTGRMDWAAYGLYGSGRNPGLDGPLNNR